MEKIDPKMFGISPRTVLFWDGQHKYFFEIIRKSRIIMKDARLVLDKASAIREKYPEAVVSLRTSAPVCSKSVRFLKDNNIAVIKAD